MLLYLKYAPQKLDDMLGNDDARLRIRQWILNWLRGKKQRPILISGPVGTGKTSIAYVLQNEYNLELIQMGASDLRNKANIEKVFANALMAESLSGKKKLLLIDDVDALQKSDSGGSSAISQILRNGSGPIILTAVDVWDRKLSGIRNECEMVQFKRISKPSISKVLKKIASAEKIDASEELIASIADGANGDVRSAINDLQSLSTCSRDREKDIFDRVRMVFKAKDYAEAKKATQGDIDYDILKLWIDENIPLEYEDPKELSQAYNYLSRADVFQGRIRGSSWGYLKYTIELMSVGVSLSKTHQSFKFVKYQFPKYLREMSATSAKRAMLKEIGKKIGSKVHTNKRDALQYLPLIRYFSEQNMESVITHYDFTEDEMAFILGTTVELVKKKNEKKKEKAAKEDTEEDAEEEKPELKEEKKDKTKLAPKEIKEKEQKKSKKPKGDTKLHEFF